MNEYEKRLIRLYLKTETAIINEIARLRSLGLADYHVVASLRRVMVTSEQGELQSIKTNVSTEREQKITPPETKPFLVAFRLAIDTRV